MKKDFEISSGMVSSTAKDYDMREDQVERIASLSKDFEDFYSRLEDHIKERMHL